MTYLDHFSEKSSEYLQYRPDYPQALFDFLADLVKTHHCAWDCGTGNGQAALALSKRFKKVIATDINQTQLEIAHKRSNIHYECAFAEQTTIKAGSIDLITVATALHWFDLPRFYEEVNRVSKPSGVISAWCYSLGTISQKMDSVVKELYLELPWPPERHYLDEKYQTILFPFKKLPTPTFYIKKELNFKQFIGYINTWSAVKEYQKLTQKNPIEQMYSKFSSAWGEDLDKKQLMTWPIHLLVAHTNTYKIS